MPKNPKIVFKRGLYRARRHPIHRFRFHRVPAREMPPSALRAVDVFALAALQGLRTSVSSPHDSPIQKKEIARRIAKTCYETARAMMQERKKPENVFLSITKARKSKRK